MKSVKRKLILWFSLSMSAILIFTSLLNFNFTKNKLKSQLQSNEMAVAEKINNDIDKNMKEIQSISTSIALMSESFKYDKEHYAELKQYLQQSLSKILNTNKDLETVYSFFKPDMRVDKELPYECILRDKDKGAVPFSVQDINEFKYWEQDWYKVAEKSDGFKWTEPYYEEATGRKLVSGVQKMINKDGQFIGVAGIDVNMDRIENIMKDLQLEKGAFCFIVSQNGTYIYHPKKEYILKKKISDNGDSLSVLANELNKDNNKIKEVTIENKKYYVFNEKINSTGWQLGLAYPVDIIKSQLYGIFFTDLIGLLIGIMLTVIISILISKSIVKNINKGVKMSEAVSRGDLTYNVNLEVRDEIGLLVNAMNESSKSVRSIVGSINKDIFKLNEIVNELQGSSSNISDSAKDITTQIKNVQMDINVQNKNIDEIYNSFEKIDGFMDNIYMLSEENLEKTIQSVKVINTTKDLTETSIKELSNVINLVNSAVEAINKLEERTKQIEGTLEVIKKISKQTKMLSLNATIEAQKAGESGKGFTVVAKEIKKFSNESAEVLKNIEQLITEVIKESNSTVESMNKDVKSTIEELNNMKNSQEALNSIVENLSTFEEFSGKLRNLIEVQRNSSNIIKKSLKDISDSSNKIEYSISDILDHTVDQDNTVDVLNKNSQKLNTITNSLQKLISKFKI